MADDIEYEATDETEGRFNLKEWLEEAEGNVDKARLLALLTKKVHDDGTYVELPKGKDGKPIAFGDRVVTPEAPSGRRGWIVTAIGADNTVGVLSEDAPSDAVRFVDASLCQHAADPSLASERIRAWVESARYDHADFKDLLAIADDLEAKGE